MKIYIKSKLLVFLIILASNIFHLYAIHFPFDMERIAVDFKGAAFNINNIVVYGNGSIILNSSDRGKTWMQFSVADDSLSILKIVNKDSNYFGILDKNYIIKSSDDGISWLKTKLGDETRLYDIASDDENLFILLKENILIYDYNLNQINVIKIDTNYHSTEILILENNIYLPTDSARITIINKKDGNINEVIDFNQSGLCSGFNKPYRIQNYNNDIYIIIDSVLYKTSNFGKNWEKAAENIYTYKIFNNEIYNINTESYDMMISAKIILNKYENHRNKIISNYNLERYSAYLIPADFYFINKDTILIVGYDKLITMSYDGGKTWDLISNLYYKYTTYQVHNNLWYAISNNQNVKGQVFKTNNGGTTWLPQKLSEYSYIVGPNFSSQNLIIFEETGKGFIYSKQLNPATFNFMITNDFGETYEYKWIEELNRRPPTSGNDFIHLIKNDSNYILIFNGNSPGMRIRCYTKIFYLDTLFNYISESILIDSLWFEDIQCIGDNKYIGLAIEKKYPHDLSDLEDSSLVYYIMYSNDYAMTWEKYMELDTKDIILDKMNLFGDFILIGGKYNPGIRLDIKEGFIFKIDLPEKKYEIIFQDTFKTFKSFISIGNSIFSSGYNHIYYCENIIDNPYKWDSLSYKNIMFSRLSQIEDKYYAFTYNLTEQKYNIYKLNLKLSTSVETPTTETKLYFWAFPPYPQPASNIVKVHIYWDRRYDIDDAVYMVYDIMGNKIEGKENISLSVTGRWDGELKWNCKNATDGVYFISVKYGDTSKAIPVIINN